MAMPTFTLIQVEAALTNSKLFAFCAHGVSYRFCIAVAMHSELVRLSALSPSIAHLAANGSTPFLIASATSRCRFMVQATGAASRVVTSTATTIHRIRSFVFMVFHSIYSQFWPLCIRPHKRLLRHLRFHGLCVDTPSGDSSVLANV